MLKDFAIGDNLSPHLITQSVADLSPNRLRANRQVFLLQRIARATTCRHLASTLSPVLVATHTLSL